MVAGTLEPPAGRPALYEPSSAEKRKESRGDGRAAEPFLPEGGQSNRGIEPFAFLVGPYPCVLINQPQSFPPTSVTLRSGWKKEEILGTARLQQVSPSSSIAALSYVCSVTRGKGVKK